MRKILCIVTVCFMIVSVLSGCSVLQKFGFGEKHNDELQPVSSIVMGEEEAKLLSDKVPVHLYFATEDNTKLKLEVRYLPIAEANKSASNLATKVVEELIAGPKQAGLKPTIPVGTKLAAPVSIDTASVTATVNFTKDFVEKHPGGENGAKLTIYSIVNSLTEIKEIQKVKFLINGKAQADFKGSFQFNAPFPRSASLISKVVEPAGSAIPTSGKETTNKQVTPTPKPASTTQQGTTTTKPAATTQQGTTTKPAATTQQGTGKATPTPKPGDSKSTAGAAANANDEDAEATYLEILE